MVSKTFCVVANWGFPLIKHNIMEAIKSSLSLKRDKQNFMYWQTKLTLTNKTSCDDEISAFIQRKKGKNHIFRNKPQAVIVKISLRDLSCLGFIISISEISLSSIGYWDNLSHICNWVTKLSQILSIFFPPIIHLTCIRIRFIVESYC